MPLYVYYCEANNITLEITQSIKDKPFKTWGELCKAKGMPIDAYGKTDPNAPVKKQLFAPPRHGSWSQWKAI
jgi:hypothetical protein